MSSGSISTGSTLGRFGLYRSIDARTEEFLRLSKKKQIRQGCVCAVISTAVTVTVVVSVLLIYEYSINSEINLKSKYPFKATWHGLNENKTEFDETYLKSQLNIDETTLKLLPILLKAIKQNKHLQEVNDQPEENAYETKTEYDYEKNVFDYRNWIKYPSSRLYAIEYKTTPIMYYRSPIKTMEYFTKLRKVKDYERVLKYVDKMISEKVGVNINPVSMTKRELPEMYETTNPISITTQNQNIKHSFDKEKCIKTLCKCSKKLGELLNKLISSIQKLIPQALPVRRNDKKSYILNLNHKNLEQKNSNLLVKEKKGNVQKNNVLNADRTIYGKLATETLVTDSLKNNILNKGETKTIQYNVGNDVLETIENTSTVTSCVEGTSDNLLEKYGTTPMSKLAPIATIFKKKGIRDKNFAVKGGDKERIRFKKNMYLSHEEYDDFFPTTPEPTKDFSILDVHSIELLRNKMTPNDKQIMKAKNRFGETKLTRKRNNYNNRKGLLKKERNKNVYPSGNYLKDMLLKISSLGNEPKSYNTIKVVRKDIPNPKNIKNFDNSNKKSTKINNERTQMHSEIKDKSDLIEHNIKEIIGSKDKLNGSKKKLKKSLVSLNHFYKINNTSDLPLKQNITRMILDKEVKLHDPQHKSNNNHKYLNEVLNETRKHVRDYKINEVKLNDEIVEYDIEKIIEQDFEDENIKKQIELEIEAHPKKSLMDLIQSKLDKLPKETIEMTDFPMTEIPKSMIPNTKPIYLEIQRSGWKHEDVEDFDTNVANNLFDLPDV